MDTDQRGNATALDLVRGLAALAVVLFHARATSLPAFSALPVVEQTSLAKVFYAATKLGREGVLIFFVLSGYLVFGRIIRRFGSFDVRHYAIERATRILIPLIPACILTAAVGIATGYPVSFDGTLAHMVGLNGVLLRTYQVNAPLWTLAYEIWFYVLGGTLAAIVARKRPALALSVLAVAVVVFSTLDARYLLYWFVGGVMVLFRESLGRLALVGLPAILIGVILYETNSDPVGGSHLAAAIGETLVSLGFAATLPLLASGSVTQRLSIIRPQAMALSAISYSLYLTHLLTLTVSRLLVPPTSGSVAIGAVDMAARVLLCLLVATAFWWLFERNTGAVRQFLNSGSAHDLFAKPIRPPVPGICKGCGKSLPKPETECPECWQVRQW